MSHYKDNPHACACGPGFCAADHGLGYIGSCSKGDEPPREAAPDCTRCGAPHQSTRGCWLCQSRSADMTQPQTAADRAETDFWLRCLREGVSGSDVFDGQDREYRETGTLLDLDEVLDRVLAARRGRTP